MALSRRSFLGSLGSLTALAAGGGVLYFRRSQKSGIRYCIPAPEKSDLAPFGHDQDLSWARAQQRIVPGFTPDFRSLISVVDEDTRTLKQVFVPGLIHAAAFFRNQVLLVSRGTPSIFLSLDADTMEISAFRKPPPGFVFGGHLVPLDENGNFALTLNTTELGNFDSVGIFRAEDLNEISRMSSFGFQAHDLILSPNRDRLYVGHYGSNFKSGPFRTFHSPLYAANGFEPAGDARDPFFPGSVANIDLKTGRLLERKSHHQNGPQGHLAIGSAGDIFLTKNPPRLEDRTDSAKNPAFDTGVLGKDVYGQFPVTTKITGTSVISDHKAGQFIVSIDVPREIIWGRFERPDTVQTYRLPLPEFGRSHGLSFHPDGRHYVVSCEKGFLFFTRETHQFVPEKSFAAGVADHSHFCIG